MKSNTLTIIKKEFARFFGDRQLLFTTVIMPGLLIYIIYSLMGSGIQNMVTEGADETVTLQVENMPPSLAPMFYSLGSSISVSDCAISDDDIAQLEDKDINAVLLRFPENFDGIVYAERSENSETPNVEIFFNSTNNASNRVSMVVSSMLNNYARPYTVSTLDQASNDSIGAMIWSKILPMLIIMMLFSGVMAIAPSSIAGEKERGTIATLLVTPMRRNELAIGKIISLSGIALLSGISSFVGIALSLPKMISIEGAEEAESMLGFHYTTSDYFVLLLIIFASVLIMASAVSLLSALAKDVKNAGTMVTPFMLVIMLAGLLPMFQTGASESLIIYLIPFYNSIEVMTAVFAHEMAWMPVIVTLVSNVVYTGIAVWGLTRMFNSEKVMFSA
ncbi:MAG: ABC transporter permease subunit [Bacteroidales bacterium]|nr:ABC transporter permease subunit [Bacteroidales bacterium]